MLKSKPQLFILNSTQATHRKIVYQRINLVMHILITELQLNIAITRVTTEVLLFSSVDSSMIVGCIGHVGYMGRVGWRFAYPTYVSSR